MSETINELIEALRREAGREEFPVDAPIYERSGRDPTEPIFFAGSLDAPLCIVGRDLGKDEVRTGQPLIGAAGRLVRAGIIQAWHEGEGIGTGRVHPPASCPLEEALACTVLTNTVPYKPPGNKAYAAAVRSRFRPFLEQLLYRHWKGHHVVTLGTEAFRWFAPYGDPDLFQTKGAIDRRFDMVFSCRLPAGNHEPASAVKNVLVHPLPHPSPLNRLWYSRFPSMLAARLAEVRRQLALSAPT